MQDPGPVGRLLVMAIAVGCAVCVGAAGVDSLQPSPVVVSVAIDRKLFAPDATLVAQVWNALQLAALEANAACVAQRNPATGATDMRCPAGVVYQEVSPRKIEMPVANAGDRLELALTGVLAGERYRLRIAGLSADRCNTTSGEQTSTAVAGTTRMTVVWETTLKVCGQGGSV